MFEVTQPHLIVISPNVGLIQRGVENDAIVINKNLCVSFWINQLLIVLMTFILRARKQKKTLSFFNGLLAQLGLSSMDIE